VLSDSVSANSEALRGLALSDDHSRRQARELSRQGLLHVQELRTGLAIRTTSWVGRVRLGEIEIVVVPKLAPDTLLGLIRYAYGLRDLRLLRRAEYESGAVLLHELLLLQLHAEAQELLERGLHRQYRGEAGRLASPRGRLNLCRLAASGPLTEARLPCCFSTRSADYALNQSLLGGLALGSKMTTSASLAIMLSRLASAMALFVESVPLTRQLLEDAWRSLNRLNRAYEPALKLVTMLLDGSALTIEGRGGIELPGFLFDMNRFFQALLSRFLSEHLEGWKLNEERGLTELLRYLPERNPRRRRAPRPRPDFTLTRPGSTPILLDAKYRDLWELPLHRDMLYQLALYAMSQGKGATATILYPSVSSAAQGATIRISDPIAGGARGFVALQPVPLHELYAVVNESSGQHQKGRDLADALCFGSVRSDEKRRWV
jgi:5-methylcytosine-specific restriction enzyme subunit McrC